MATESKSGELAARPSVVTPSTTQFINLSSYMYQAYDTPYADTTLQANIGFTPLTTRGGQQIVSINEKTGLYAEAFVSTGSGPKQIVVAYEGTDLFGQSPAFTGAQVQDDAMIFNGKNALSFRGAAQFARRVTAIAGRQGVHKNEVFVTGHSLGASEAEYAASKTGLAGTAFAGPGIYQAGHARVSKLTNYIDAGDPVGNYAADTVLSPIVTTQNIKHYGSTTVLLNTAMEDSTGGPNPYYNVDAQSLLSQIAQSWPTDTSQVKLFLVGVAVDQNLLTHDFHSLKQYANDLGVTLYTGDSSGGAGLDFFDSPASTTAGTESAVTPLCFVTGTRIRTTRGEVAVESLVGDVAVTAAGAARPVTWLGHRDIDCRGQHDLYPVRVAAHAFGRDLPTRELRLSPGHPILVGADENGNGGHLVPIMCLINGTTIERVPVDAVTYWHVELDAHDILLAEGLPAESYIDLGSRPWFDGADGALHDPDMATPGMPGRCRPVATDGPVVEAERRRLDTVLSMRLAAACAWSDATEADFLG